MPKRKVVFVGTPEKHYVSRAFYDAFEEHGWEVIKCNGIQVAQKQESITLLVVWAYLEQYIKEYNGWRNKPKAIWYTFANNDKHPDGTKEVKVGTMPQALYNVASAMCS